MRQKCTWMRTQSRVVKSQTQVQTTANKAVIDQRLLLSNGDALLDTSITIVLDRIHSVDHFRER